MTQRSLRLLWSLRATVLLATGLASACGAPALTLLVVVEESTASLDTSEVKSLLVRVGDEEEAVLAPRDKKVPYELKTEATGQQAAVVVFACDGPATCAAADAEFVGCSVVVLAPSAEVLTVQVALFDVLDPDPACEELPGN